MEKLVVKVEETEGGGTEREAEDLPLEKHRRIRHRSLRKLLYVYITLFILYSEAPINIFRELPIFKFGRSWSDNVRSRIA